MSTTTPLGTQTCEYTYTYIYAHVAQIYTTHTYTYMQLYAHINARHTDAWHMGTLKQQCIWKPYRLEDGSTVPIVTLPESHHTPAVKNVLKDTFGFKYNFFFFYLKVW